MKVKLTTGKMRRRCAAATLLACLCLAEAGCQPGLKIDVARKMQLAGTIASVDSIADPGEWEPHVGGSATFAYRVSPSTLWVKLLAEPSFVFSGGSAIGLTGGVRAIMPGNGECGFSVFVGSGYAHVRSQSSSGLAAGGGFGCAVGRSWSWSLEGLNANTRALGAGMVLVGVKVSKHF
jgi:hypothetical protein